jgi:hypothetical protein
VSRKFHADFFSAPRHRAKIAQVDSHTTMFGKEKKERKLRLTGNAAIFLPENFLPFPSSGVAGQTTYGVTAEHGFAVEFAALD